MNATRLDSSLLVIATQGMSDRRSDYELWNPHGDGLPTNGIRSMGLPDQASSEQ